MKIDFKRILYIIATTIFIISFCIVEVTMIIECINAYFNGTTWGIRFFTDNRHFGIEGVKDIFNGWGFLLITWFLPITIYQILYFFDVLIKRLKSIKENCVTDDKNEIQSEKAMLTIFIVWIIILLPIPILVSGKRFFEYCFNVIPCIFAIIEIIPLIIIRNNTKISFLSSVILGILFYITLLIPLCSGNFLLFPITILLFLTFFTTTFVVYDAWLKKNLVQTKVE